MHIGAGWRLGPGALDPLARVPGRCPLGLPEIRAAPGGLSTPAAGLRSSSRVVEPPAARCAACLCGARLTLRAEIGREGMAKKKK